jgi:hypothetical protein
MYQFGRYGSSRTNKDKFQFAELTSIRDIRLSTPRSLRLLPSPCHNKMTIPPVEKSGIITQKSPTRTTHRKPTIDMVIEHKAFHKKHLVLCFAYLILLPSRTMNSTTFPYKLYNMLHSVSENSEQDAPVAWLPQGNGFVILDKQAFLEKIIPVYFNLTLMKSFTRQLNLWGFEYR